VQFHPQVGWRGGVGTGHILARGPTDILLYRIETMSGELAPLDEANQWRTVPAYDLRNTVIGRICVLRIATKYAGLANAVAANVVLRALFYAAALVALLVVTGVVKAVVLWIVFPPGFGFVAYLIIGYDRVVFWEICGSFDFLYLMFWSCVGAWAMMDLFAYEAARSLAAILIALVPPFLLTTMQACYNWVSMAHSRYIMRFTGVFAVSYFSLLPLLLFFDQVPDLDIKRYKLVNLGGKDVFINTFSVVLSAFAVEVSLMFRFAFTAFRFPDTYVVLRDRVRYPDSETMRSVQDN